VAQPPLGFLASLAQTGPADRMRAGVAVMEGLDPGSHLRRHHVHEILTAEP
jgi:hypothetical protein